MKFIRGWRKHIGVLSLLLVVMMIILITTNGKGVQNEAVTIFDRVTYPLQWVFSSLSEAYDNLTHFSVRKSTLLSENAQLKEEILELRRIEMQLKELRRENSSLKMLLGYAQAEAEMSFDVAEIIYRDPNDWYRQIVINVGENNGIKTGMTVVAVQAHQVGLVGIVDEVYPHTSRVHLIVDPMKSIATAAQVEGVTETISTEPIWYQGIVEGSHSKQGKLEMFYITHEADIAINATVMTTGLGGHYVTDVPIGYVESIELDGYGLLKRAVIKPNVDFNSLKEILVIKDPYPFTNEIGEKR